MYDDRTYDNIMEEMMDGFGQDVNTDESSLAYNACAKIAEKLEDVYADMSLLNDNIVPDTMDLDHLITFGKTQRGIEYEYATSPIVKATFEQEIEIGQQFTCGDYTYTVTEVIEGFSYKMVCDTEGIEANTTIGELSPVDYVDDYKGGNIVEILVPGTDDEDEETYRARVMESFKSTAFGGNRADYRGKIDALDGVGGCKPKRRDKDSQWIVITILSDTYDVPTPDTVKAVQDAIDPEQSHGEGDGLAPICHNVMIVAVTPKPVSVAAKVTWDEGFSKETSKSQIDAAVQKYLLQIRNEWEKNEFNKSYVRISQIEAKILEVQGVVDVENATINGLGENMTLEYNEIPTFGGVALV